MVSRPICYILLYLTLSTYKTQAQSACRTPTGSDGRCIMIYSCEPIVNMIRNPQRTQQDLLFVKASHCGFESNGNPKVCCQSQTSQTNSKCSTPDGREGTCVGLSTCNSVQQLLKPPISSENMKFIQQSICEGSEKYNVCCASEVVTTTPMPVKPSGPCTTGDLPNSNCCGMDVNNGDRIYGGVAASIDQYPWLVVLEYRVVKDNKIKLLCGGALISGRHVLTAAHCVTGPVLNVGTPINVRVGEYDTATNGVDCVEVAGGGQDCTDGAVTIAIEKIIPHPNYNPQSALRRDDIALLKLQELAPYTDFIRPICLPTKDVTQTTSNLTFVAAGWGAVDEFKSSSNIKIHVDLPFSPMQQCQPMYNVSYRRVTLWSGQLCAGGEKGKDSCKGDSGGPLMFYNNRHYEVTGVVSFGPTPCGIEDVPGVYTKVHAYLPWIESQIQS